MNSTNRRRVKALERRRAYLRTILADWKGGDRGRTAAEADALEWALEIIDTWDHRELILSVEQVSSDQLHG